MTPWLLYSGEGKKNAATKKKAKRGEKLSTQRILKKEAQQQREREAQGRDFPKLWLFCVDKVS